MDRSKNTSIDWTKPEAGRGTDFLQLDLTDVPVGRRAQWIADRIRDAVADGALRVGSRLPPSRTLAAELGVSRGVVTEAYRRLSDDGHVAGHGRNGTVVQAAPAMTVPPPTPPTSARSATVPVDPFLHPADEHSIESLRDAEAQYDLSPGVPSLAAFPRRAWLRAERSILDTLSARDLGYGDPRGAPRLREAITRWLARNRGIRVAAADVLVVSGVSQGLTLLSQILRRSDVTRIAVEDPGSMGLREHLRHHGMRPVPIPVDAHGVQVDQLRDSAVSTAVVTPAHQFPMGVVLSGARRRELLEWSNAGGLVVEDDYDAEHRYDRAPVPALRSLAPHQVCYLASVSKLLAPALRIGWLVPPPRLHSALVDAKRFADLGNAVLPQLVLAELMDNGDMERHLRFLRTQHRRRRNATLAALGTHLPAARVHGAAAGLHLTITLDAAIDDTQLAASALRRGVKVQPLSWHRQEPGPPGLVLGYAATTPTALTEAVAHLAVAYSDLG
ncbi:PLP-dependent aminotransferase family protein [Spiractinospora alimapuensis]|uniref:MocR-like pyridoxine biosynthesis transcription factor PdxR n=1 Tax=Spiractinospora alimapuensis TaxID=2820884 RepID=UPI001F1E6289|nr:PLP-dependent aminotransferase family protein [Spiractinospora alimapuensis]QVQ50727.1 PLP-dependent aminotransferase family protein [Spiractinospora alimapuensis]